MKCLFTFCSLLVVMFTLDFFMDENNTFRMSDFIMSVPYPALLNLVALPELPFRVIFLHQHVIKFLGQSDIQCLPVISIFERVDKIMDHPRVKINFV